MKPKKTSMETIRTGGKFSYGDNARVQASSLPKGGAPAGSKGKPR